MLHLLFKFLFYVFLWLKRFDLKVSVTSCHSGFFQAGFDFAISEKLKVIPTCSYVLKYVNEHLEEKHAKNNVLMS